MREYKYVSVEYSGLFILSSHGHKEIINKYAKDGYAYVGHIPTKVSAQGQLLEIDLIFEIEV